MTFCFIQAIERGHGQGATYGSILTAMRHAIRNATGSGGVGAGGDVVTTLIGMLLTGGSVSGGFQQVCPCPVSSIISLMSLILVIIHHPYGLYHARKDTPNRIYYYLFSNTTVL